MKKKKIVFFDRDGVVNKNAAEHCYIEKPEDFALNPGIGPLMRHLAEEGFEFIVITNQRGIARGIFTEQMLAAVHSRMRSLLADEQVEVLDILYCPHGHDACNCRKPKPGLLYTACARYEIDLAASILVSDSAADVRMGEEFGIGRCVLVERDNPTSFFG